MHFRSAHHLLVLINIHLRRCPMLLARSYSVEIRLRLACSPGIALHMAHFFFARGTLLLCPWHTSSSLMAHFFFAHGSLSSLHMAHNLLCLWLPIFFAYGSQSSLPMAIHYTWCSFTTFWTSVCRFSVLACPSTPVPISPGYLRTSTLLSPLAFYSSALPVSFLSGSLSFALFIVSPTPSLETFLDQSTTFVKQIFRHTEPCHLVLRSPTQLARKEELHTNRIVSHWLPQTDTTSSTETVLGAPSHNQTTQQLPDYIYQDKLVFKRQIGRVNQSDSRCVSRCFMLVFASLL